MKPFKTEAFLLQTTPYGESDLVVGLLTRRFGRLSAIARGARRSRRRFGGALDYFHLFEAHVRPGRTGLGGLLGVDLVRAFDTAHSIETYFAGCHFIEVARLGVKEGDPDESLFGLIEASLEALRRGSDPKSLIRVFQARALGVLGYSLPLAKCPACGRPYSFNSPVRVEGEVLCAGCAGAKGEVLTAGAVRTLEAARDLPLEKLGTLRISSNMDLELGPLLEGALASALGSVPRSLAVLPGR